MMCIGKRGSIIGGAIGGGIVCAGIAALIAFVVCRKRASDGTAGSAAGAASISVPATVVGNINQPVMRDDALQPATQAVVSGGE
jgi:hypothetical protein